MDSTSIILGMENIPPSLRRCSLAIGNFEGVHLGHQRIVQTARILAANEKLPVVAMTFDPPPELVIRPEGPPRRITPIEEKCRLLLSAGADHVVVASSSLQLLAMPPKEFVQTIIVSQLAARYVVEGRDFHFGAKRGGDINLLGLLGCQYGFAVHVVEAVMLDFPAGPQRISSTLIRQLVARGNVEDARRCMNRPYTAHGLVVSGEGQGKLLDFPTVNLGPCEQIIPADGVYAGRAVIEGQSFAAAISVGHKPTLGPSPQQYIEAHLLDASGDFYGQAMALSFLHRLRDQEKFADQAALKAQIAEDVEAVRAIFAAGDMRST